MPDIQGENPSIPLDISNVCVQDLRIKLCLMSPNNHLECHIAHISACVDLSRHFRGIHVSRSVESILITLNNIAYANLLDLQMALKNTAERLLIKHDYSSKANLRLKMEHICIIESNDVPITIYINVKLHRSGSVKYSIGINIRGMTVCPCAQQVYAFMEDITVPSVPSHSQRATLHVRIDSSKPIDLDLCVFIRYILSSFSTSLRSFLKRDEEYMLIKTAFRNPKFAEDVAREAAYKIYRAFREKLSDDAKIAVKVISYESIHPFNLRVEISHCVRELDNIFTSSLK